MADIEDLHSDDEDIQESKYLMCVLGDEEYGINIVHVQSIEELQKISAIPDMPAYVKGVINLRGKIIPVIDLRRKFQMPEREYDDRTCIVITKIHENSIGMIVDTVSEVKDIKESDIVPPFDFGKGQKGVEQREQYIQGLGRIDEEVKILLDAAKLMQEAEIQNVTAGMTNLHTTEKE